MIVIIDLWKKIYCSYTKDYSELKRWVDLISEDPNGSLEIARKLTRAYGNPPDVITLGFSPQVLVGALSLKKEIIVITSPEVEKGEGPGALSKALLDLFRDRVQLKIAPFAPSPSISPDDVINELVKVFREVSNRGAKLLDVSGGTQLVPIAAIKAGFKSLSYAYPDGEMLSFYEFRIEEGR